MIEIRIHGRGGQGGVTLAKLIATMQYLRGMSVQAFGIYAAERSGAPVQAFCRYSSDPITNRNLVYTPDHLIVLDPTLIKLNLTKGLKPEGWILINTPKPPEEFWEEFPGYRLATVDATSIALENKLGTKSLPIVNTALLGAFAKLMGLEFSDVVRALEHSGFVGANIDSARTAFERVRTAGARGEAVMEPVELPRSDVKGLVDGNKGEFPKLRTGDWANRQPKRQTLVPPCNHNCPAGNDIQGFIDALAKGNTDRALEVLLRTTPFPSTCGRVCPAPCMDACNRKELDGSVNIRDLERYAGDYGKVELKRAPERPEKIAIIGSGPAGLTAAYHLALLGYRPVIYEAGPKLGGLLRTGIPQYRLPRDVLDREIDRILSLGVEPVTNYRVDRTKLLKLTKKYDAILVATGLQKFRTLDLGQSDGAVMEGIEFLDLALEGKIRIDGERVAVIGGGNTAIDAARSALRIGASDVQIVYRRTRAEMPAIREEIEHAQEEGISFKFLSQPIRLEKNSGKGYRLICQKMKLGEPDASGRRRPVPVEGETFAIECDRVILALGQTPELTIFPEGTEVTGDSEPLNTLPIPVFAVGDVANQEGTVTAAIGSGRRAALYIHRHLTGEELLPAPYSADEVVSPEQIKMYLFEKAPTDWGKTIPAEERKSSFTEVHLGLDTPREALRCFSCGVCNQCDNCVIYCPEGIVKRVGDDYTFDYDYCKGCGVCAAECPRDVIYMDKL